METEETFKVIDTYANGKKITTFDLTREDAQSLILTAARFIEAGILHDSVMLDYYDRQIARAPATAPLGGAKAP